MTEGGAGGTATAERTAGSIRSKVEWTTTIDPSRCRAVVDAVTALRAERAILDAGVAAAEPVGDDMRDAGS